jgi:hypothetical protein
MMVYLESCEKSSKVVWNHIFEPEHLLDEAIARLPAIVSLQPHAQLPNQLYHKPDESLFASDVQDTELVCLEFSTLVES